MEVNLKKNAEEPDKSDHVAIGLHLDTKKDIDIFLSRLEGQRNVFWRDLNTLISYIMDIHGLLFIDTFVALLLRSNPGIAASVALLSLYGSIATPLDLIRAKQPLKFRIDENIPNEWAYFSFNSSVYRETVNQRLFQRLKSGMHPATVYVNEIAQAGFPYIMPTMHYLSKRLSRTIGIPELSQDFKKAYLLTDFLYQKTGGFNGEPSLSIFLRAQSTPFHPSGPTKKNVDLKEQVRALQKMFKPVLIPN